ncbi:MAG: oligosaccharide flippase family protein, partial [Planctomycetota bacterium]
LVLVRHLVPADFGRFAMLLAATGLVLSLGSLRVGVQVIRERSSGVELSPTDRDRLIGALVGETTLLGGAVLGWMAWSGTLDGLGLVLVVSVLLRHLQINLKAFHERTMAYRGLTLLETASQLAGHGAAVALVLAGVGAPALYLRELVLTTVALVGLAAIGGLPRWRPRLLSRAEWRRCVRDARDVWADGTLEGAFARVLPLAAGAVGGHHGAGLFVQAHRLARVPHQLLGPVAGRLALNWFSRTENRRQGARGLLRLLALLALPLATAAVGTLLFAERLIPWLFGAGWEPVAPLMVLMLGGLTGISLFASLRMFLIAGRAGRTLLLARLAQFAGLGLGLLTPLVLPTLGGVSAVALGFSFAFLFGITVAAIGAALLARE